MTKKDKLKAIQQGYMLHTMMCIVTISTILVIEYNPKVDVQILLLLLAWLMLWQSEGEVEKEEKSK